MGMVPLLLPLFHACAIGGGFIAHLEVACITEDRDVDDSFWYSRVIYDPYYVTRVDGSVTGEFEETYPGHVFGLYSIRELEECACYEIQEEIDNYKPATQDQIEYYKIDKERDLNDSDIPDDIPTGVEYLSVIVRRWDAVVIQTNCEVTYVIVDDDGDEMSYDEVIEQKITENYEWNNR